MGIACLHGQLQFLQDFMRQEKIVLSGLQIAELGNQYFRADSLGVDVSAKKVFRAMGANHWSFDINEKDGAHYLDLSKPIPEGMSSFDLVTNFGTSEHVEESQFQCWKNIHDLCRWDGHMIHTVPAVGHWPRHGTYHYTKERLCGLAMRCTYEIRMFRRHGYIHHDGRQQDSLLVCFQKRSSSTFPEAAEFQQIMFPEGEAHY